MNDTVLHARGLIKSYQEGRGELQVLNGVELGQEVDLVKRYFPRHGILGVLYTAVRELSTLNRQLAKLLLEDIQQFLYHRLLSSNFEVVNVYRHDA